MRVRVSAILAFAALASLAQSARADFFVISGSFEAQAAAQLSAAESGGWVLDTDAYESLTPGVFAVVRGPFRSAQAAREELGSLEGLPGHSGSYIKDAGRSRLPTNAGSNMPPAVLAALLGELSIEIQDHPGGTNPCEPAEPYQSVELSYVGLIRTLDESTDTFPIRGVRTGIEVGRFDLIKRTGEISRMRECYE